MLQIKVQDKSAEHPTPEMSNLWASGGHIACWQSCCGQHDVFDLEIITSPGNYLCNVARSEVDLQKKKRSLPLQHLHLTPLLQTSLFRNRVRRHEVKLISNKKKVCTSQVSPVLRSSNVSSKMKRCNTAEIY